MEKNKTGKYLKYAIGEIILVVIGILIALSINNWNEGQIRQNDINKSLAQILNDLLQDKRELEIYDRKETEHALFLKNVSISNNVVKGLDTILKSLDHYMAFSKNNNGYSGLKSSGKISNINNNELKSSLTYYYEKIYESLSSASHFSETFTNNRVIPFSIENLRPNIDMIIPKELVLEKLETTNLRYLINYQISVKNYSISQLKRGLKNNAELILLIDKELRLKK